MSLMTKIARFFESILSTIAQSGLPLCSTLVSGFQGTSRNVTIRNVRHCHLGSTCPGVLQDI